MQNIFLANGQSVKNFKAACSGMLLVFDKSSRTRTKLLNLGNFFCIFCTNFVLCLAA